MRIYRIIVAILLIASTLGYSQNNSGSKVLNDGDECDPIESFESHPLNSLGNWLPINLLNSGVVSLGSKRMHTKDGSGASYLYNFSDFPKNWLEEVCEIKYDVKYEDGVGNRVNATNSLWIFDNSSPSSSTVAFKFVLYNELVSGSTNFTNISVPVGSTSDYGGSLPSNAIGEWQKASLTSEHQIFSSVLPSDLTAFNNLIQNVGAIGFMLDVNIKDGVNSSEDWWFDNFCIRSCIPDRNQCCQTDLEIFNVSGTSNPLPVEQLQVDGSTVSVANETFEIHNNATIPITELRVTIADLQFDYNYEACAICVNNPAQWGSLMSPSTIGSKGLSPQRPTYTTSSGSIISNQENVREIVWTNPLGAMLQSGDRFDVNYILPKASEIPCCATSVKICIIISYKDANCNVCEIPTCSVIELSQADNNPSCQCGEYRTSGIRVRGLPPTSTPGNPSELIRCGGSRTVIVRSSNLYFTAPVFACEPEDCRAETKWEILKNNEVIDEGTGNTFRYNFNDLENRLQDYVIRSTPICGGKECEPCEITLKLKKQ